MVYVADTDEKARKDTEEHILHHIRNFNSAGTSGYFGSVTEKDQALDDGVLAETTPLHGSPATAIAKLRALQARTGMTSLLLHDPPYYGHEKILCSLTLFAQ